MSIDPKFDILLRATEQIKYPRMPELDRLTVSVDQRSFATVAQAQFQDLFKIQVTCRDATLDFRHTDMGRYGDIAPVFRATSGDGSIDLDGGFLSGQDGIVDFRTWKQCVSADTVAATVWVLVGGRTAIDFPESIPVPEGLSRPWFMERGLRCEIGGAPAIIRRVWQVAEFPEDEANAFAIARVGDCEDGDFLASLRVVLSLIFGTWLEPAIQYRTTAMGEVTWRRVDSVNSFIDRAATPAVASIDRSVMASVGRQLDVLLKRCDGLLKQDVRLDVALQYLLNAHDGTEAEIRDMCSAIDAVAESRLLEVNRRKFISKKRFGIVQQAIDDFLIETLPQSETRFRARVKEILTLARTESPSEKQRLLWDATHIKIGRLEREALKHRHDMAHKGYIPFDYDDNKQWRLIFERSGLLRSLANRMLLSVLGFTGEAQIYHGQWENTIVPISLESQGRIPSKTSRT